ncbi:hypothetical protein [Kibdelosporangium aridum]
MSPSSGRRLDRYLRTYARQWGSATGRTRRVPRSTTDTALLI